MHFLMQNANLGNMLETNDIDINERFSLKRRRNEAQLPFAKANGWERSLRRRKPALDEDLSK